MTRVCWHTFTHPTTGLHAERDSVLNGDEGQLQNARIRQVHKDTEAFSALTMTVCNMHIISVKVKSINNLNQQI